jgi:hypothetical protein
LEKGERLSKLAVMEDLDSYYGCGDLLVREWRDARREVIKDKYRAFMDLEATAQIMWMFQLRVPGLLQTEDYARAVLSGLSGAQTTASNSEEVEEQVAARMGRQELLYRERRRTYASSWTRGLFGGPFLRRRCGRSSCPTSWTEGNGFGELVTEADKVLRFRLSYDRVRDAGLTPLESTAFIKRLLEECRP